MKLYTFDPAPNPQRLKMFIDYKGIELDATQVNFQEGEQRTDAYKAVVPTGIRIPLALMPASHPL